MKLELLTNDTVVDDAIRFVTVNRPNKGRRSVRELEPDTLLK
jgi:hypothetical protein